MKQEWHVEPVLLLLFFGLFLSIAILVAVQTFWPNDGQVFQVISGVATGFAGAFFARMNPKEVNSATTHQEPQK